MRDVHTLLTNAGIPGPYVLVGHSFGGLYTRLYAAQHPDEVAGMVLLDASHPDQWTRAPQGPTVYATLAGPGAAASPCSRASVSPACW